MLELVTPQQEQSWPKGYHMNRLGRGSQGDAKYKINYQGSRPSSFRVEELWNFRSLFLCSTYDPRGGASFDPRGILWTNLVNVHKEMPHTKDQISKSSTFREKKFWRWASLFLCSNLWPSGQGQFWLQGHHMNRLGRGLQGDAIYQILKL